MCVLQTLNLCYEFAIYLNAVRNLKYCTRFSVIANLFESLKFIIGFAKDLRHPQIHFRPPCFTVDMSCDKEGKLRVSGISTEQDAQYHRVLPQVFSVDPDKLYS